MDNAQIAIELHDRFSKGHDREALGQFLERCGYAKRHESSRKEELLYVLASAPRNVFGSGGVVRRSPAPGPKSTDSDGIQ